MEKRGVENPFAALRHRPFALFWATNLVSSCGVWVQNLAQVWLVLQLSDSASYLGAAGFVSLFPTLAFSLLGGTVADRLSRRRVLIGTQTALMVLSLCLGLLTSFGLITARQIVLLMLLSGIALALNSPAYQAVIPDLVPQPELASAIALNSVQFNVGRIVGHSIGGVAVAVFGPAACFYANALSYLPFLITLWLIPIPSGTVKLKRRFLSDMTDGLARVRNSTSSLFLVLVLGCVSLLGLPYFFLLPAFARDVLGRSSAGLGYLTASVSVGALSAAFAMPHLARRLGKKRVTIGGAVVFWVVLFGFSLSRSFWLSFGLLMVVGFNLVLVVTSSNTLLQLATPTEFRGRVMSIAGMAVNGLAPVGALAAGALADYWSAPAAVAVLSSIGWCVTLGLVLLLARGVSEPRA